jgi:predicted RNA-binding Zn ribbon-like protein
MRLVTLDEAPGPDGQPLFVEFVNTLHWYEGAPIELIGTDAEFADWLLEQHLPQYTATGCLPEVHRLREHVRGLTTALATNRPLLNEDIAALQAALSAPIGSLTLMETDTSQPHLGLATNVADSDLFSFRVALSVAAFLRSPQRHRLKLCANPTCGFAFVDTSINATRRWCDMRYCGNRLKVRAFRGRQKPPRSVPGRTLAG